MIEIGKVRLFTIDEIGKKFKVTSHTIRGYLKSGRLAGQKLGKRLYVSETALEDYFRSPYRRPGGKKVKG